ncbi:MAG TPA: aminodeoxychorismate lyase, partial [Erythrobacter sp.]|nr:aminodeoxychorismate lyase [Erythrobacter sp.]
MKKAGCLLAGVLSLVLAVAAIWFVSGWWGSAEIEEDTNFIVPSGASLTSVAEKLAEEGVIADPEGFLLRAKILGSSDPILAGEFLLPAGASSAAILDTFQ